MNGLIILFNIVFFFGFGSCKLSCKDENNNDVDWFIALKYPKGYDFVYLNAKVDLSIWHKPKINLLDSNNFIGLTINQTFSSKKFNSFFAYYNDEKPVDQTCDYPDERGHLKGVINFDGNNGFWLIHSVPKFPSVDRYYYGKGQSDFAQSFVCISLKSADLKSIIGQLLLMESTVYNYYIPDNFTNDTNMLDSLNKFVKNEKLQNSDQYRFYSMTTFSDFPVVHIAKSRIFNDDLYASLVAPQTESSIFVETWIRGDEIHSNCDTTYKVYNVKKVNLSKEIYTEHNDHSKWVVSQTQNPSFVCIGDINRMTSQFKRGGGTLCIKNVNIWSLFHSIVNQYEKCDESIPVENVLPLLNIL